MFKEQGLIERCGGYWVTTQRGRLWVKMICSTPMPEQKWVDPRTGEQLAAS